ncbi:GNAT family N-acetyltransferase OS=Rhodanobacter lindaniclasticus OX=75310 GN=B1991_16635 PE=4 SV=1 [Rhodanobacter lindaniclasticus]
MRAPISSAPVTASTRVRRADLSDLDELVELEQRAFDGDRLSRTQYRRHLDSDSAQVLVASNGRHDFFGSLVLFFRKRSRLARVYSLATRPESRGLGIGAALLQVAAATARRRGCTALRLEVRPDNAAAIRLYERAGFQRIGAYRRYYEDGADAWRYELPLDARAAG